MTAFKRRLLRNYLFHHGFLTDQLNALIDLRESVRRGLVGGALDGGSL